MMLVFEKKISATQQHIAVACQNSKWQEVFDKFVELRGLEDPVVKNMLANGWKTS
jgi:hypothetical protein